MEYDIDHSELVRQNLPTRLRLAVRRAWLESLAAANKAGYTAFSDFREEKAYELAHNGQIPYLEAALNDVFDDVDRTIYITDGEFDDEIAVFLVPELRPAWLATVSEGAFEDPYVAPAVLYTSAETLTTGVDFIVHVPGAVAAEDVYDIERLKAIVNKYKLAGKRYTVVVEP